MSSGLQWSIWPALAVSDTAAERANMRPLFSDFTLANAETAWCAARGMITIALALALPGFGLRPQSIRNS